MTKINTKLLAFISARIASGFGTTVLTWEINMEPQQVADLILASAPTSWLLKQISNEKFGSVVKGNQFILWLQKRKTSLFPLCLYGEILPIEKRSLVKGRCSIHPVVLKSVVMLWVFSVIGSIFWILNNVAFKLSSLSVSTVFLTLAICGISLMITGVFIIETWEARKEEERTILILEKIFTKIRGASTII